MGRGSGPVGSFKGRLNMQPSRYGDLIPALRRPRPGLLRGAEDPPGSTWVRTNGCWHRGHGSRGSRERSGGRGRASWRAQRRGVRHLRAAGGQRPALWGGVQRPGADQVRARRGHGLTPAAAKLRDGEGEGRSAGVALRMRVTAIDGHLACSGPCFAAYAMFNALVNGGPARCSMVVRRLRPVRST